MVCNSAKIEKCKSIGKACNPTSGYCIRIDGNLYKQLQKLQKLAITPEKTQNKTQCTCTTRKESQCKNMTTNKFCYLHANCEKVFKSPVKEKVKSPAKQKIKEKVTSVVKQKVKSPAKEKVKVPAKQKVKEEVTSVVKEKVKSPAKQKVKEEVTSVVKEKVKSPAKQKVKEKVKSPANGKVNSSLHMLPDDVMNEIVKYMSVDDIIHTYKSNSLTNHIDRYIQKNKHTMPILDLYKINKSVDNPKINEEIDRRASKFRMYIGNISHNGKYQLGDKVVIQNNGDTDRFIKYNGKKRTKYINKQGVICGYIYVVGRYSKYIVEFKDHSIEVFHSHFIHKLLQSY
jgi:hypothetical protein